MCMPRVLRRPNLRPPYTPLYPPRPFHDDHQRLLSLGITVPACFPNAPDWSTPPHTPFPPCSHHARLPHKVAANEVVARGHRQHMSPVKRFPAAAGPTDEPSAASIKGAKSECTPYTVDSVTAIKGQFPTVWETAALVSGDTAAQSVWSEIQKSNIIPAGIQPKGTGGKGDFSSFTPTYDPSDPDCWWTFKNCVTPKHSNIPEDVWQCAEPETWGLSFDDGPNCSHNAFYDYLNEQKQKATMFYIGSNVLDWPLEAQRGIVDGHHICVHTWSHQYMTQLTDEQVFAELYYTGKAIKDITGVTPRCWRPPFGDVDDRVRAIATGLGMSTNIWSDDTDDWQILPLGTKPKATIEANYNSIINKDYSQHGNLVLTHEINGYTMDEMMQMYPSIKQHFKNIVPITACMNETSPYPENISYPNFAAYVSGDIMPAGLPSGTSIKAAAASYDPLAAASQTAAAGDSTGGSTSSSTKQASTAGKATNGASSSASSGPLSLLAIAAAMLAAFA